MTEFHRAAPQTLQSSQYLTMMIVVALFLQVIQIGLFNTELTTIRLSLGGATLVLLTIVTLIRVGERSYHAGVSIIFALTMLASWTISTLLLGGTVNWSVIGIQLAFPIYLGAMGSQGNRTLLRWVALISAGTVIYAATYAVVNPRVIVDFVPRARGFFDMNPAPHNSAYIVGAILILFYLAGAKQRQIPKWFWAPVILIAATLLYFYKVRTAQVMVFGFFAAMTAPYLKQRFGVGPLIAIFFVLLFGAAAYAGSESKLDWSTFSSGRTSVYSERLTLLADRDFVQIILGSGPGSDSFYSDSWWWDAKNSHNDFLTAVIERGVVGLGILVWYIFAFCRARQHETIAVAIAIVLTGALSNGLFQRPLPLLFAALAIWVSATGRRVRHRSADGKPI